MKSHETKSTTLNSYFTILHYNYHKHYCTSFLHTIYFKLKLVCDISTDQPVLQPKELLSPLLKLRLKTQNIDGAVKNETKCQICI